MMQRVITLMLGYIVLLFSQNTFASNSSYEGHLGVNYWSGSTKVNDIRYEKDKKPFLTFSLESDLPIIPEFKFRYSEIDAQYTALEKYDYTFYYKVFRHQDLALDLGFTISDYKNSQYTVTETNMTKSFNGMTLSFYANGAITIPNTDVDIIGQYDFYEKGNKKTGDFIAGIQYQLIDSSPLSMAVRTGYRVMDYTFYRDKDNEATVFIDGWFLGLILDY